MSKIIVVDDEATITTHLEERLTNMGYEVMASASSGKEAVKLARSLKPDLVLMDIVMPGEIDGIEAAGIIQKELNIPIVFLSAYGDDKFIARAKEVEPFGYIIKPYQDESLKAAIEIALYNRDLAQKLKESEEQWRSLAENIQEGIVLAESSGRIIFWNKGAENIFGYSAQEALGKHLTFMLSEAVRLDCQQYLQKLAASREREERGDRVESIGLRKDWTRFPLELTLSSWRLKDRLFLVCLMRDITIRKREEEGIKASLREKEALLAKIRKQVEANLELVYSLLGLQFEYLRERQTLALAKERENLVHSLAQMQEKLLESSSLASLDFASYVRNLIDRLCDSYRVDTNLITFRINVENIFLSIKTAIPCGLIISELVANSLKYSFPAGAKGRISVEFYLGEDDKYYLMVGDNGRGFPKDLDIRQSESPSFQIVFDLVSQLKGDIKLDRRGGTKFKILFPKEES